MNGGEALAQPERPRRGRPPKQDKSQLSEVDEIIGRTAWQLYWWGHSLRGVVCKHVALAAAQAFSRDVGPDRVEQIMEVYAGGAPSPSRHAAACRRRRVPNKMLNVRQLADRLLRHGGVWPHEPGDELYFPEDLAMTPSAHRALGHRLVGPQERRLRLRRAAAQKAG